MKEIQDIDDKFIEWSKRQKETDKDHGVSYLLGLSGGADSMVLLHCCLKAREEGQISEFSVVHVNHLLRGKESDEDEVFIEETCRNNSVPCETMKVDVSGYSDRMKKSTEESARILRYMAFSKVMAKLGAEYLLLGHNLSDQYETFFMRLLRGTGIGGLECMGMNDPFPINLDQENTSFRVLRPFLSVSREEIRHFASRKEVAFREDSSNQDLTFFRNRVRNILIPALDQVSGSRNWAQAISDLMSISSLTHEVIKSASKQWYMEHQWNGVEEFELLPIAIQQQFLIDQLSALHIPHPISRINQLLESEASWINTGKGEFIRLGKDGFVSKRLENELPVSTPYKWNNRSLSLRLDQAPQEKQFEDTQIRWEFCSNPQLDSAQGKNLELFDADAIGNEIILRFWRPGDVFQPSGFSKPIKLKKWFSSQRIPENQRSNLIVAESPSIGIFWIQGMRIAEKSKILADSSRGLLWEWENSGANGLTS